jgi:hypothetical protein
MKGIEEYSDGKRRQWKYFCTKCGKFLGDSACGSLNPGTREEISDLLCNNCREKDNEPVHQPER